MDNSEPQMYVIPKRIPPKRDSTSSMPRKAEDLVKVKKYDSASDFLKDIVYGGEIYSRMNNSMAFRGLKSGTYALVPSVLRDKAEDANCRSSECTEPADSSVQVTESEFFWRVKEYYDLRSFFNICDENGLMLPNVERIRRYILSYEDLNSSRLLAESWLPYDLQELAALAQHYGLKTRLLDWSSSIDTAIYFAVHESPVLTQEEEAKDEAKYIAIWMLDTSVEFKSDSLRLIRPPYWGNPNLYAQKGLFTLWQEPGFKISSNVITEDESKRLYGLRVNRSPLDERLKQELIGQKLTQTYMWKFLIPRSGKKELWEYINKKGVTAASLFPGYAGVARSFKESRTMDLED